MKHFGQRASFSHYCYEPTRKNVRSVVDGNELYVAIGSSANNLFHYSYHESEDTGCSQTVCNSSYRGLMMMLRKNDRFLTKVRTGLKIARM